MAQVSPPLPQALESRPDRQVPAEVQQPAQFEARQFALPALHDGATPNNTPSKKAAARGRKPFMGPTIMLR